MSHTAACDSKDKEKYTILSSFMVFIFMNSSTISMLQRKMLKVSIASGEAEGKKNLLQESALKIPLKFTLAQQ